jgi:hypothetical protein
MKLGIIGAIVVALPFSAAMAQSPAQKQADLAEALRVQQVICNGIADVRARGGDYTDHDLARCIMELASQRAEYVRSVAANASPPRRVTTQARVATTLAAAQ